MSSSEAVVKQSSSGKRFTFKKPPTAAVGPHIPPPPVSAPKQVIEVENIDKPQCSKVSSFGRQITDLTNDDDDDFFQMDLDVKPQKNINNFPLKNPNPQSLKQQTLSFSNKAPKITEQVKNVPSLRKPVFEQVKKANVPTTLPAKTVNKSIAFSSPSFKKIQEVSKPSPILFPKTTGVPAISSSSSSVKPAKSFAEDTELRDFIAALERVAKLVESLPYGVAKQAFGDKFYTIDTDYGTAKDLRTELEIKYPALFSLCTDTTENAPSLISPTEALPPPPATNSISKPAATATFLSPPLSSSTQVSNFSISAATIPQIVESSPPMKEDLDETKTEPADDIAENELNLPELDDFNFDDVGCYNSFSPAKEESASKPHEAMSKAGNFSPVADSTFTSSNFSKLEASVSKWPELSTNPKDVSMSTQQKSARSAFTAPKISVPSGAKQRTEIDHNLMSNDSTEEFEHRELENIEDVMVAFKMVFGLKNFRDKQLASIKAAVLGYDCFILMPTGGGKSLCYQLPAVVSPGVTVVVSPLRSLIQDQLARLTALGIAAAHLSGEGNEQQANQTYRQLACANPVIRLLYVTPEKLGVSNRLNDALRQLYDRGLLARLVIDEAHCVSQWGHDFRPDYKKLSKVREKFPKVPIMALTATANARVRKDISHQLALRNPKFFISSFNRPNLEYHVLEKKPKGLMAEITNVIKTRFRNLSGIVYCLSRKECEQTAMELRGEGIKALAYHAGLGDEERAKVQEDWAARKNCDVVTATIAFGMGIDKPDVRYVIHQTLPKSLEGYYQEAGRAGRDGKPAQCLLYYYYGDVARHRRMIEGDNNGQSTRESKQTHLSNLFRMVHFCENKTECRRVQTLAYFGENFDAKECNKTCDNCSSDQLYENRDFTREARTVVETVKRVCSASSKCDFTVNQLVDCFRGLEKNKLAQLGHHNLPCEGVGKQMTKTDCERLLRRMVIDGYLAEKITFTVNDNVAAYVRPGPGADPLLRETPECRVLLPILVSKKKEPKASSSSAANNTGGSARKRPAPKPESSPVDLEEECYRELVELARVCAQEHGLLQSSGAAQYRAVLSDTSLRQMAEHLPMTLDEMIEKVDGVTRAKMSRFGVDRFLEITNKYAVKMAMGGGGFDDDDDGEAGGGDGFIDDDFDIDDDEGDFDHHDVSSGPSLYFEPQSMGIGGQSSSGMSANRGRRGGRGGFGKRKFSFNKRGGGGGPRKKRSL